MDRLKSFLQIFSLIATTSLTCPLFGMNACWAPQISGKVIKQWPVAKQGGGIKAIVIDAGHGGHDPGCLGVVAREKNITLRIALQLAEVLRAQHPQLKVVLTRDKDVFIPLYERAAIANRNDADLFISIHCNAMPGSSVTYGTETYVMGLHTAEYNLDVAKRENASVLLEENFEQHYDYDPNSPEGHIFMSMYQNAYLDQSIEFAALVEEQLHAGAQRRTRGVKQAGFVVLKATAMPSVLIETGFLSNRTEEQFLNSELGQQQVAQAIARAFDTYQAGLESAPLAETPPATPSVRPVFASNPGVASTTPPNTPAQGNAAPLRVNVPPSGNSVSPAISRPIYYVQIAALRVRSNTVEGKLTTLPFAISPVREDAFYKYRTQAFTSLSDAKSAQSRLRTLGFPDAFILAFKNGIRVSLEEAGK